MKEGEPVLGGPQANPGGIQSSNFGVQPVPSATPQPNPVAPPQSPVQPQPRFQSQPQPQPVSSTPIQPSQPIIQNNTQVNRPVNPMLRRPGVTMSQSQAPTQSIIQTQPNPIVPTQPPIQPISSSTGDIILDSRPNKSKKPIIIAVVALVVLAIIAIVVAITFNVTSQNNNIPDDIIKNSEAMLKFGDNYTVLLDRYSVIGYNPVEDMKESIESPSFFPIDTVSLALLDDSVADTNSSLENLRGQISSYNDLFNNAQDTIDTISSNVSILSSFNDAFMMPVYNIYNGKTPATSECSTSDNMRELIDSLNENISQAAKLYELAYCKVNQLQYNQEDLYNYDSAEFIAAKLALTQALLRIDSGSTGYDDILSITNKLEL